MVLFGGSGSINGHRPPAYVVTVYVVESLVTDAQHQVSGGRRNNRYQMKRGQLPSFHMYSLELGFSAFIFLFMAATAISRSKKLMPHAVLYSIPPPI